MVTADEIDQFEAEIAKIVPSLKYPVHLRKGNQQKLVELLRGIRPQDYLFNYWGSHGTCLIKGVPCEVLKQAILDGRSIACNFPEYRHFASGIVGSLCGVAVGTAYAIKRQGKDEWVYHVCGDMGAETGIFYESAKFAHNHDLPITFIVEDNGLSVMTPTRKVWVGDDPRLDRKMDYFGLEFFMPSTIRLFNYHNEYPHAGVVKGKSQF